MTDRDQPEQGECSCGETVIVRRGDSFNEDGSPHECSLDDDE